MQKAIDEDNERYDNAVEEDPNLTHVAVVSQEPYPVHPRIKISAQTINQMIRTMLLSIPGVDPQPDTIDKGPFGSWMYMMEAYAAERLALACITNPLTYTEGQRIIHLRRILEEANNNRANNSRSIPRQLLNSSLLHVIVRIFSVSELRQIRLKYLATSMSPELDYVKGQVQPTKARAGWPLFRRQRVGNVQSLRDGNLR
jgi:hypothetical protein